MPFSYKVEIMPSGSANVTSWLDVQGTSKWQLIQVIPLSPVAGEIVSGSTTTRGEVLCYFMSGSN